MRPNIDNKCKDANAEQVYVCPEMSLHGNVDWSFSALAPILPQALIKTSILEQCRLSGKTQDKFSERFWGAAIGGVPPLVFV